MGLRLVLMRHAKSAWDDLLVDDFDRPLNKRGRRDAPTLGKWLMSQGYLPDQALVSSALRTRETFEMLGLEPLPPVVYREALYHASSDTIMAQLQKATGDTVLLIGHNPGIGDFARRFAKKPSPHAEFSRYPTLATTVFDVSGDNWAEIAFGRNRILDFVIPRDLEDM